MTCCDKERTAVNECAMVRAKIRVEQPLHQVFFLVVNSVKAAEDFLAPIVVRDFAGKIDVRFFHALPPFLIHASTSARANRRARALISTLGGAVPSLTTVLKCCSE